MTPYCIGCSRLIPADYERHPCPLCGRGDLCWECVICRCCEEDVLEVLLWVAWWGWIFSRYGGC